MVGFLIAFSLCFVELIVLLSNAIVFKSSSVSDEEKIRYGYFVIFFIVIIIAIAASRSLYLCCITIRERRKSHSVNQLDTHSVRIESLSEKPEEGKLKGRKFFNMNSKMQTGIRVNSFAPSDSPGNAIEEVNR